MGIRDRASGYVKNKFLGGAVSSGWDSISTSASEIGKTRFRPSHVFGFWRGPATEEEGRAVYVAQVLPAMETQDIAEGVARAMVGIGVLMLIFATACGVGAIFIEGSVYKISMMIGFLILALHGTVHLHRAAQIRAKRVFGLRELFF